MNRLDCILLIDDDHTVNYLHSFIIENEQITRSLKVTETGEQALEVLNRFISEGRKTPELILLDLNMPKMDGWKFLDEYRKLDAGKSKIVVLSSSANPDDRRRAENHKEVAGFYNKPLTGDLLQEILRKHFGR